jgi:peptidoglycan/xylan/chitin deacetylase (PgdA/CDA1 family)
MDDKVGGKIGLIFDIYNKITTLRKFSFYCLFVIMVLCIGTTAINVKQAATTETRTAHISNINTFTNSSSTTMPSSSCHCVIFRLSGIQDYFAHNAQLAIMDLFLKRNQSLSLGMIMNSIGNDTGVVEKIVEGRKKGIFELAINGWNYTDYSKLTEEEQKNSLSKANEKMQVLFGRLSNIFIPPYGTFENSTLKAMHQLGMKVLSSSVTLDKNQYFIADGNNSIVAARKHNGTNQIYHMPAMTSFNTYNNTAETTKVPIDKVIRDIGHSVSKYGYAVINLDPQFFLINKRGIISADLNEQEINNLSNLIEYLISKNIHITTFSKVTGVKLYANSMQGTMTRSKEGSEQPLQADLVKEKNTTSVIPSSTPYNLMKSSNNKVVILTFDDGWKSQYSNAIPVLNKYGFKATFFIICNFVGVYDPEIKEERMSWKDIETLHNAGYDIETHTMNHANLTKLSANKLNFEVGQSKQCLRDHSINSTIMATPFDAGWNNATVINIISKYFDLARNGNDVLTFLHCDGWPGLSSQTDCRTYSENGNLNFANRYSLRGWNHNFYDNAYHNNTRIFTEFVEEVNKQKAFNKGEVIKAIPIIIYHNVDYTGKGTDLDLFSAEMKYLHDNGFKILTMSDLEYDEKHNVLLIKRGVLENITIQNEEASAYPEGPILYNSNLKVEEVFTGLNNATSMAFLDQNDILVLDKNKGTVQRIVNGTMSPKSILDVNVANKDERHVRNCCSKTWKRNGN